MSNFSIRLQELRVKKQLTQKQLADLLGVTDKAISKWENDGGMPEVTILPTIAKVFNVTTDYLLTGEDNTKPLSIQELCAKNDDLELYNELKKRNVFAKDGTSNDLWHFVQKYDSVKVAMQIYKDGNLIRYIRPKDYRQYRYATLRSLPEILIKSAHYYRDYEIYDAFKLYEKHTSNLPFDKIIDEGFEGKNFNQELFDWLFEKKDNAYWLLGIDRFTSILVEKDLKDTLNKILNIFYENNKSLYDHQNQIKSQSGGTKSFGHGKQDMILYNNRPLGQYFVISEKDMKLALKKNMVDEVKKMNNINAHTSGKNAYIVEKFEFYKDSLDKDDSLGELDKKIKEITFEDIVVIDELIKLDNVTAYKKYIKLPATVYEKGFDLIEEENYRGILELAVKTGFNQTVRKVDSFNKNELKKIWAKEIKDNYKKGSNYNDHRFGNKETLLRKTIPNYRYYVLEPTSILYQSPDKVYEWLKNSKYVIKFRDIIKHKSKFFFEKAIQYDKENINWALENIEPDRFEIIKLLLDNDAKLLKHWDDEEGMSHTDVDAIGTEILRKRINEIVEGK
jgi:transcriptional regulator with XRE-family HTH domain